MVRKLPPLVDDEERNVVCVDENDVVFSSVLNGCVVVSASANVNAVPTIGITCR